MLRDELSALAARVAGMLPAEASATIERGIAALALAGNHAPRPGDAIPAFALPDATGAAVTSATLLARGPLLLVFYRGEWCPYCNLLLRALQSRLAEIAAAGATLVAISPQLPEVSWSMARRLALGFPVLSDAGNEVAASFGLRFALDAEHRALYAGFGVDLASSNGDDSATLPLAAAFLVGADGIVREARVETDYRQRAEPDELIGWARRHAAGAAR
ncbi:peroxiredoxin-like family protein [Derxia gummosa]|uniref:thioredoxin-dependent peroxiredoxin n=1 Tax=Derxia gummosa DSM 723 TaxID=1121388 RepID=A0A8B6X802_9BURK|nr:peroxiredoxin-like family protein [Derxia gummosa]